MPLALPETSWNNWSPATVQWSSDSTSNTSHIWTDWTTANSTACTQTIWVRWQESAWVYDAPNAVLVETPEQITEREAAWKRSSDERQAAERKAKEILERHLTEEQRAQLARDAFFVVRGSGGKLYRIQRGRTGNVKLLGSDGQPVESLCAHPSLGCPDEDTMLAQKLMLETDEEAFYRVANKTRVA